MTVKRELSKTFKQPTKEVEQAINRVLSTGHKNYSYHDSRFEQNSQIFYSAIRPNLWPLLLQTPISIQLSAAPHNKGTKVVAHIESQWYVLGDIFAFYDRYLRDLFGNLEKVLNVGSQD